MATVRLIYSGAGPIFESAITGRQVQWVPGRAQEVDTTIAATLLGVAGFGYAPTDSAINPDAGGGMDSASLVAVRAAALGASRPIIAGFGDSFVQQGWYGWLVPWSRNESTTLPGINYVGMERKVASGAHTLTYTAATKSCSFDGGPETALVNGFQVIPGPTSLTGCGITVRLDVLSASNGSLTCTRAGTRPDEILDSKGLLGWLNIYANQGYLVRGYGHGGGMLNDGVSIVGRVAAFDGFVVNYGTNDIAGARTLAQLKTDALALVTAAYNKSRSGSGVVHGICPFRSGWTTAQSEIADAFNRWLPGALRAFPGVVAKFPWVRLIDATGAAANTAMINGDNTHPDDPAAQLAGYDLAQFFGTVLPGTPCDFGSALGVWSATNATGNRFLNPNPTGNVSGAPTGWGALSVGANGTATPSKVARTDGIAGEWARITGSATADNVTHSYTIPSAMFVGAPANGDVVQAFVEVRLSGAGQMIPLLLSTELKAGSVVAFSRVNASAVKSLQHTDWVGVIATPPYVWSDTAGANTNDVRIGQRLNNGATNATLDIGRCWFGAPVESSIG
jgi:hypothetical protein